MNDFPRSKRLRDFKASRLFKRVRDAQQLCFLEMFGQEHAPLPALYGEHPGIKTRGGTM